MFLSNFDTLFSYVSATDYYFMTIFMDLVKYNWKCYIPASLIRRDRKAYVISN